MDSLTGDQLDQSNEGSINLIQLLNQKQGQNSKAQIEDQDSSLENNHSQSSNDENENNHCDESENQKNIDINSSQCQHKEKPQKGSNISSSSQQKNNDKLNKKNQGINIRSKQNRKTGNDTKTHKKKKEEKRNIEQNNTISQIEEEQKNENKKSSSVEHMGHSASDSQEENNDDNQFETIEEDDQQERQSYQRPRIENYHNSPFNFQEFNEINENRNTFNQALNNNENRQNDQNEARDQLHPLQSLFHGIFPHLNEQTRSLFNQRQNAESNGNTQISQLSYLNELQDRNSGLASLASNIRREQRQQRRQRSSSVNRQNDLFPEGFQILSSESAQNQIRYFYCAAISLLLISCFLLYSVPSKNQMVILLILSILIAGLFFIFYKIKRIIQIRQNQIHENNYFSYRFSNQPNIQNDVISDGEDVFGRISNQAQSNPILRNTLRNNRLSGGYLGNMILLNSIFSIIDQMQLQTISQDSGYTEEQINQIGGAHKYDELKMLLKIQKEEQSNNDDIKKNSNDQSSSLKDNTEESEGDCCIVCLEQLEGDVNVRILKCQHYFHQSCLDEWLKKKKECPVCRQCPLEVEAQPDQQRSSFHRQFLQSFQRPPRIYRSSNLNVHQLGQGNNRNRGRQNMNLVLVYQ